MIDLTELQAEIFEWVKKNFPTETESGNLLSIGEEAGELFKAFRLETETAVDNTEEITDAICDTIIGLLSFCSRRNIIIEPALKMIWSEVKKRDYQKYPRNGRTK